MKALNFRSVAVVFAAAWLLALPSYPLAQGYPNKAVRVVVPFAPGGATDIQARVLSRELGEQFRQSFVVDNRPGASGMIGAEIVVNSAADGYTILFSTAALAINATLSRSAIKFDPLKDLAPVILTSSTPLVLIVHPNVAARSAEELIEFARKNPARLNAAITVSGSTSHLAAELFRQLAGISFTAVPYKGGAPAMLAMVSGEVDFLFAEALLAAPQIKGGKVRALAVTTSKPSPAFPDLPTLNALLPGFVADNWFAIYAPAGTSREIVATMNASIGKALDSKTVRALFEQDALIPAGGTPEELGAHLKRETERYAEVIRKGNITAQ
ncbi:MAG: tripartite tricarboxylate transporter substrate binding protein [Betaproteobacteria bacterium]|nr:tripartite tricarboxylate transporter substrate binding protein [Betaproteobacteria bacterium]